MLLGKFHKCTQDGPKIFGSFLNSIKNKLIEVLECDLDENAAYNGKL